MNYKYDKQPIELGDTTTHGGRVTTATSSSHSYKKLVRSGDWVDCPKCGGTFRIERGCLDQNGNELPYAVEGQRTSCGATLVSRSSLGLVMREDGKIDSVFTSQWILRICEYINMYLSRVTPTGPGGVFSYARGTVQNWIEKADKPSNTKPETPPEQVKTALYIDVKNEDTRFDEYLPFKVSVDPGVSNKSLGGEKAFVGEFEPGSYLVTIEPTPPPGEELGPVPWQENRKFVQSVTLSGKEEYLRITITRKESIEHNIMMSFLVEDGPVKDPGKPPYELSAHASNTLDAPHIHRYSAEFGLEKDWVQAICYMETSHGWYDAFAPYLGQEVKSVRPMNVNIDAWEKLFAAKGVTRADLEQRDINIREGCFLLHRLHVRAKPKTLLAVASLYNTHRAEYLDKYGFHVKRIYDQRLWETGGPQLETPDFANE